jgi:hypothetical protein
MHSTTQMQRTAPVQSPSKSEPSARTGTEEGQESSTPATGGAWDGVARQGHRFDALPVISKPAPPSSSQPIQAKWKDSGFKPGDKVFGTSNGSGYNVAAQKIRKEGLASESSDVNMGSMIQYIKDPKDPENEPPTHPEAAAEWNAFKDHHAEWASKKPSRQVKDFKHISKAAADFTTRKMGKNIHFVPGNLDWAQAADKSTGEGKRTTAHELRYIYRNWDEMKNQVQFYSDAEGTQASAPWEHPATKASWDAYAERRAQKKKQ